MRGFLRDRSIFTFCLFLIFAAILWFGHALNAVRERTMTIPIIYTTLPENIAFEQSLPTSFRFTIRDQGKRLQKYKESMFAPVEVDLTPQLTQKEGHIHIAADQIRGKIADQLQGTAKIQNIRPEVIEGNYYTQEKKRVKVRINGTISPAAQYMFADTVHIEPSFIYIYGKQSDIDSINEVSTTTVNFADLRDSIAATCSLEPISGIRFSTDSVLITAQVEQFTEKNFTLSITTKDVPAGEHLRTFPSTVQATVRISLAHFNDITENSMEAVCHYPKKEMNTLPVVLRYTDKHIIQARVTPAEVEYIIEH